MSLILSERLTLRPFTKDDITTKYLGWLNDKELMAYSRQRYVTHTRESCERYLESFRWKRAFFWNATHTNLGVQIGTATAYVKPSGADVGLLVGYPGVGYGTEMLGAIADYLFRIVGVAVVTIGTMPENVAMVRIAHRWGMRYVNGPIRFRVEAKDWKYDR